ncbi:VOC family protein [Pseudoxanthomonas composti]|uniref:VOC family protein n=1 Tax=Pseudoxanthomonas composti TaxID=2137479 RepID=A0A4Q1JQV7_9GAMM|nr:VOC family protein [Pseudoxanthomonas composti]RXQ98926.1 VOC family protein [Pseudoxanthomonas composti]
MSQTPPLPFALQRLDHVVLRVRDSAVAEAFYCGVLGCQVARRRDDLGLVHLQAGASMIDLVALDGPLGTRGGQGPGPQGRNVDHLCLQVAPFHAEAIAAHLAAHGVWASEASMNFGAEGEGPSLYFSDPDGNTVELKGPACSPAAE